jgi:hypothetical protein
VTEHDDELLSDAGDLLFLTEVLFGLDQRQSGIQRTAISSANRSETGQDRPCCQYDACGENDMCDRHGFAPFE